MLVKIQELREKMIQVVSSKYYTKEEAEKMVDVLQWAELSGKNTHGILKLFGSEPLQNIEKKYSPKVIKETKLSAMIDGGGNPGPLGAQYANNKVLEIVKNLGIGIVTLNNTFSSVGALGYYVQKIADKGFIGFAAANAPRSQVHFPGIEPMYGTNPLAYGFPTEDESVVFDISTSALTFSGLVRAKMLGLQIPDNKAIDENGNVTTDPLKALDGALLPFDNSYKGSGLAMTVEILAGVLSGAHFNFDSGDWGTIFIAIDPELTIGLEEFKKRMGEFIQNIKNSKIKDQEVHIPGYDKARLIKQNIEKGEIEVDDTVMENLNKLIS